MTIRPVLGTQDANKDGMSVGAFDGGTAPLRYHTGGDGGTTSDCSPYSPYIDYGGGDLRQTGLVVTCGMARDAVSLIEAVEVSASTVEATDMDEALSVRRGFRCEELRESGFDSDYISFDDYKTPTAYHIRTSKTILADIIYDGAPIHGEDASHNIKTERHTAWVVPEIDKALDKSRKGDLVEIRIDYINSEAHESEVRTVRKCSVQRIDLGSANAECGGMMFRKVYDFGSAEKGAAIATQYGADDKIEPIKTRYDDDQGNQHTAPLSMRHPEMSRTAVFVIAFNKSRLVVYRTSDSVIHFKIASCRAIHSVPFGVEELSILYQNEGEDAKEVMSEYEVDGALTTTPAKYLVEVNS